METGFSVEGARSKRAVEQDQPAQEPMRVQKLRRNPDNGQKKVRRQMQRKTAAEDRKGHSVTCPQCGATGIRTSIWPDGSRLDAYCDNCHWRGTKIRKTKESTVDFNQREAEILTAMGRATLPEQQRLAAELGQVRAQRTAALEADREIDVSSAVIRDHLTPVAVHTINTTATDWLDDAESGEITDPEGIVQAMRTEASLWFGRVSTEVKADREEFAEQAQGYAHHAASAFGVGSDIARRAFLDAVGHLHSAGYQDGRDSVGRGNSSIDAYLDVPRGDAVVTEPFPDSAPGPQNSNVQPWDQGSTTGDSNTDASAQVEEHTSSLRAQAYASHQTHSLISQSALRVLADDKGFHGNDIYDPKAMDKNPKVWDVPMAREDPPWDDKRAALHTADDSPGKVDEDQSGNAESQITDYNTMGNDPEPFDEKMNGPLQPTGPFAVPSTRAPNVQGSIRPIAVIAAEIDINSVPPDAQPYLAAMDALTTVDDSFGPQDDGRTIVSYFLANAPGISQEAELRTHVAMTLDEARAAKAQLLAELRGVTAGDPQSGEAQSHDSEVAVGNPNDRPMWPWETPLIGDEGASGTDGTASNVADVPTPGGESGYPQPKSGSATAGGGLDNLGDHKAPPFGKGEDDEDKKESALLEPGAVRPMAVTHTAGFPLCAAGCNVTISADDDLVNTTAGLAHAACTGSADPFVREGQGGGEQHVAADWSDRRSNPAPTRHPASPSGPNYRIVPSERAGYGPGQHVVQKYDHHVKTWFDVGDPKDTRESAEQHLQDQHKPGRGASLTTAAYNPLADPNTPYNNPKKPTAEERQWREQFPEGVPLHGDLTEDQQRVLRRRSALQSQAKESRACELGNHSDCHSSSCTCPHHNRGGRDKSQMSGACAAGDHGSCKMSHGTGPDDCQCRRSSAHTSSLHTTAATFSTAEEAAAHLHKEHGWAEPLAPLKNLKRLNQEHSAEHNRGATGHSHKATLQKGAPFAGYKDFDACVAANKDKRNPEAYCGKIKHQVEGAASHKVHPSGVVEVFDHDAYRKEKTYYNEAHDKVMDHSRIATDGQCGRSWDDAVPTSWTPAPSGRCPFEYEHHYTSSLIDQTKLAAFRQRVTEGV